MRGEHTVLVWGKHISRQPDRRPWRKSLDPISPDSGSHIYQEPEFRWCKTTPTREKLKAQAKLVDKTDAMQAEATGVAQEATAKFAVEKNIAKHVKTTLDDRKGPTWHCIVGRNFGSFVTHQTKHSVYFYP